jgi:hypothetical protein
VPSPAYLRAVKAAAQLPGGRRRHQRWEFQRELRFSYRCGEQAFFGSGRTKDLSEDGVRFENDHEVPDGLELEVRISWPVLLQNVCQLDLVIRGPVIRSDRNGSVVQIEYCEFQTHGDRSFEASVEIPACSVLG